MRLVQFSDGLAPAASLDNEPIHPVDGGSSMIRIKPFEAIRPPAPLSSRVSCPPYDVMSTAEAASLAEGNPHSFLHVIRPEIDLPSGTDPHDNQVYSAADDALRRLLEDGALRREDAPGIYLYRQVRNGKPQTGVVCCCHVEDYRNGIIKKHETTRPDKEDDRTRHVLTLDAQTGPVFLTCHDHASLAERMAMDSSHRPDVHFVSDDGVTHTIWSVQDPQPYLEMIGNMDALYVADGHHRTASALRAAETHRSNHSRLNDDAEYNWFLSVIFQASELTILPYNRVVADLNNLDPAAFLERLGRVGTLLPTDTPEPDRPCVFGVHVDGQWHTLAVDEGTVDWDDPIASLDVSILQDRVLGPILDIQDPRTNPRIHFVGGVRGTDALREEAGPHGVAFALHPTNIRQLLSVADAGQCMPPKSTWFEPKLRSGLFVHSLDTSIHHASESESS